MPWNFWIGLLTVATVPAAVGADGWDRAIDALLPRVVKLYGLSVGSQAGYGTGVVVSPDGLLLTVNSLLIDARRVRVVTSDGTLREAEVVRRDAQRQLALLRLFPLQTADAAANASVLAHFDLGCDPAGIVEPDPLRPGDWLLVAGNPFKVADGAELASLAHGVFSTRIRLDARRAAKDFPYHGDVLVIDAITGNPGAAGSAVVDLEGRFVGLIGREVTSNLTHTHLNYAIPRDVLCDFMKEPATPKPNKVDGASETTDLATAVTDWGIRLTRTGYRKLPPMVERVRRDSSAERAGIRQDDLILSVNGANVSDPDEFEERVRRLRPGEDLDLVVRRGRSIVSIRLEAEKPK